jgi:hypothetical protein
VRVSPRSLLRLVAVSLTLAGGTGARRADAQEQFTPGPARPGPDLDWELAGKAAFGAPPVRGGTTPFGAGFGGRLGFSIANVYLGASVVDYLGSTDVDAWSHGVLYGGELGYGIRSGDLGGVVLVVRPQVGVGGLTVFHTTPIAASTATTSRTVRARADVDVVTTASGGSSGGSSGSASNTTTTSLSNVYVQPGVTMMVSGKSTFAGVNANVLIIPGVTYGENSPTTWMSYGLEGQLGVRF